MAKGGYSLKNLQFFSSYSQEKQISRLKTKNKQQEDMKRILSKTQILQVAKSSWPQKNQNFLECKWTAQKIFSSTLNQTGSRKSGGHKKKTRHDTDNSIQ